MKRGYYTIDNSDLYWYYDPKTNLVGEVTLYYKKGIYKGFEVDRDYYNIIQKRIQHWEPFSKDIEDIYHEDSRGN